MLGAGAVMQGGVAGAKRQDMLALKDSCRHWVGGEGGGGTEMCPDFSDPPIQKRLLLSFIHTKRNASFKRNKHPSLSTNLITSGRSGSSWVERPLVGGPATLVVLVQFDPKPRDG